MGGNIGPELQKRAARCRCKMCGAPIKPKLIQHDRFGGHGVELYCEQCRKVEYGTEPEVYQLARDFVDMFEFNYFPDMEEDKRCEQLNVAKLCDIFAWALEEIGLLDEDGIQQELYEKVKNYKSS